MGECERLHVQCFGYSAEHMKALYKCSPFTLTIFSLLQAKPKQFNTMTKTYMVIWPTHMERRPPRQRALMGTDHFQAPHLPPCTRPQAITQVTRSKKQFRNGPLFPVISHVRSLFLCSSVCTPVHCTSHSPVTHNKFINSVLWHIYVS